MVKKHVDDFIKEHNHINYCEAVIYPDGMIEYAIPSHVEKLMRITGEDKGIICDKMPITASPIIWLVEYTKCISVWTQGYIKPKIHTKEQEDTLEKLFKSKLVVNENFGW